jgi:hypothetical protein
MRFAQASVVHEKSNPRHIDTGFAYMECRSPNSSTSATDFGAKGSFGSVSIVARK